MISIESKSVSGEWSPLYFPGEAKPIGMIMYDSSGSMSVQFSSSPRTGYTAVEKPTEIFNGYVAYYGEYEVDINAGTVTHHRKDHLNPKLSETSVVRYFQFQDDNLTLTVAPDQNSRLNWGRIK